MAILSGRAGRGLIEQAADAGPAFPRCRDLGRSGWDGGREGEGTVGGQGSGTVARCQRDNSRLCRSPGSAGRSENGVAAQGGGLGELLLGDLEPVGAGGGDVASGVPEHLLDAPGGGDEEEV